MVLTLLLLAPSATFAGSTFEVSGWIPYWRTATGTLDVSPHLSELTEVNPFVYSVSATGDIIDNGHMSTSTWTTFVANAQAQKVRVVPTIMWSNASAIHSILSSSKSRLALERAIVALVKTNGYDGIDIDFENKQAKDKNVFSLFLKGLYQRIGNSIVTCDIEPRAPDSSRFYGVTPPADADMFANDYVQINKYCDRVHIMAYDQQGTDLELAATAASSSQLYAPVGDTAWVEKVVKLAKKTINPRKIIIGVPTYGYEYDVTAYANNQYFYDILWTFNPLYAVQTAAQYGLTPTRNSAGELSFSYTPNPVLSTTTPVSALGPEAANVAATSAALYATTYNSHLSFRYIDWPDAQSLQAKIDLAKRLGVRGVAIFKLDGGEDPNIWATLQGVKK